jgi:recombination protein RecT
MTDQRPGTQMANRQQMTAVQRAAHDRQVKLNSFLTAVVDNRADIERYIKPHGISFDFFQASVEVGLRQLMKTDDKFFEVVPVASFIEAVLKGCFLGLLPDGKEGAIVRFAGEAAFLPMVEGFSKKLWKTGMVIEINHNVVCEGDDFEFEEGDNGFVSHKRSLVRPADAEVIGAWCVIKLKTGGQLIEVVDQADLRKIAAVSKAQKGPRVEWAREMHRKAPFRRIVKRMPKDEGLSHLIAHDDTAYDLESRQPAPPPESAVPRQSVFGHRAVRTALPAAEQAADEGADEQRAGEQAPVDDRDGVLTAAVTALRQAEDPTSLAEAVQAWKDQPLLSDLTGDERLWLEETARARLAELLPPPRLRAIISSATGEREYQDADLWMNDILAKLSSLKGDPAAVFWKKNLEFILEAGEGGFDAQADRLLEVAAERGLPTDPPA